MSRVDNDLFFDGRILTMAREETSEEDFFVEPSDDQWTWWEKVLAKEWRFAMFLFGAGFLAVFVNQMPIYFQVVLGAPIFEEMFKFGFALLLVFWIPWSAIRIPVALAVGAGFGVLEHVTTYPSEDDFSYLWRIAFHALSPGTTMIFYQLMRDHDRLTWPVALAPSVLIHYFNNTGAVIFLLVAPTWGGVEWFSVANIVILALAALSGLVLRGPSRRFILALTSQLWARAQRPFHQRHATLGSAEIAQLHTPSNEES